MDAEAGPRPEVREWDRVLDGWRPTRSNLLLREYSDRANAALLASWLPEVAGRRVLKTDLFDEAVSEGLVPWLRSAGAVVVGVDASPSVVAAARRGEPQLEAHVADVRKLDLADESFDIVVSNSTLDHFARRADLTAALRDLHRVLKSRGILLLTLDNPLNPIVAVRNALPSRSLRALRLVPYSIGVTAGPSRLRRLLEEVGFQVERDGAIMHFPRIVARPLGALGGGSRLARGLLAFERLGRLPSSYLTGQFIAVRAVKL